MKKSLVAFAIVMSASALQAQPVHGDLVFSTQLLGMPSAAGAVMYFDPNNPSVVSTLTQNATPSTFSNWVRMAPNNTDVVVAEVSGTPTSFLVEIDPAGVARTIVSNVPGGVQGFELDGDNTWVLAGSSTSLWGVEHTTGQLSTFGVSAPMPTFNEMCITREGAETYAIANFAAPTGPAPKIYAATRSGVTGTIFASSSQPLAGLSGIELDPKTGDFITTDFYGPSSPRRPPPGDVEVNRVTRAGVVTTLATFGSNCCRVDQDDTVWVGGFQAAMPLSINGVLHYDLANNAVITLVTFPSGIFISSLEIYGSRVLTCNGQGGPGKTINVNVTSQDPFVGNASYQLACSFARRPGIKFPNGQWLHLNVTDNLFILTAQNLAPAVFQNFSGQLNGLGSATATVKLPNNFPASLGVTVFCSGVIFGSGGVLQVMNTHWFEL